MCLFLFVHLVAWQNRQQNKLRKCRDCHPFPLGLTSYAALSTCDVWGVFPGPMLLLALVWHSLPAPAMSPPPWHGFAVEPKDSHGSTWMFQMSRWIQPYVHIGFLLWLSARNNFCIQPVSPGIRKDGCPGFKTTVLDT